MPHHDPREYLPDVKDGLTHRERVVLWCLKELQQERGDKHVPTGMLYGSVVEYVDMNIDEMQSILVRLIGRRIGDRRTDKPSSGPIPVYGKGRESR